MTKESPTAVFRRAVKHLGKTLSPDDIAVLLGAVVERERAAEAIVWQHLRALSLFCGVEEVVYVGGKRYAKGSLVRHGSDIFIATRATSAPLTNRECWLQFSEMGEPPKPAPPEKRRKKVQVTEHDARGRIKTFIETWEAEQ